MYVSGLFRQRHSVKLTHIGGGVLFLDDLFQFAHYVGVLGSHVVILVHISGMVDLLAVAALHIEFPVALAHSHLVGFVELPIQEVVLLLLGVIA